MITIDATQLLYWIAGIIGTAFTILLTTFVGLWGKSYFKQKEMHAENQKLLIALLKDLQENPLHRHMDTAGCLEVVNIEPRKARANGA